MLPSDDRNDGHPNDRHPNDSLWNNRAGDDEVRKELAAATAGLPLPHLLDVVDERLPTGATIEIWLWDHQRRSIVGLRRARSVAEPDIAAEMATMSAHRVLRSQGEELGLASIDGVAPGPAAEAAVDVLAPLLALSVRSSETTSDAVAACRRTETMSLPAEMQWRTLPPSRFEVGDLSLSAAVEPAYDTGGDIFDYALIGDSLFLAVLDAKGHGLRAATTATVAAAAMRRARRNGEDLLTVAAEIGASIGAIGFEDDFVTALLMEIDLRSGEGRWLSAGHLPPLLVGDDAVPLQLKPTLPLGMVTIGEKSEPVLQAFQLGRRPIDRAVQRRDRGECGGGRRGRGRRGPVPTGPARPGGRRIGDTDPCGPQRGRGSARHHRPVAAGRRDPHGDHPVGRLMPTDATGIGTDHEPGPPGGGATISGSGSPTISVSLSG